MNELRLLASTELDSRLSIARAGGETARSLALLTCAFWLFNFALLTLTNLIDGVPDWEVRAGARLVAACAGIVFCYAIHLTLRAMRSLAFGWRAGAAAILSIFAGDGLSWIMAITLSGLRNEPIPSLQGLNGNGLFTIAYHVWFFLAWSAMYLAFSYAVEVRAQERRWSELRELAHATHLRALSYQIQPHFLFNTLNSIATLVLDGRNAESHQMIGRLSAFLRASLSIDPLAGVRLSDEVALQRRYLEIEQVRFPDLVTSIDIPSELQDVEVPSMILQPLIENAVKYSVSKSDGPASIAVVARQAEGRLVLTVEDNGASTPVPSGSGIGLRNVRERLREQFGDEQSFEAGPLQPRGFGVRLSFPLKVMR